MSSESDNQLDTTELLAQLKGVHLPEAPVPADLWPIYASLAVCTIALLVFARKHLKRKQTWHKTALQSLKKIEQRSGQRSSKKSSNESNQQTSKQSNQHASEQSCQQTGDSLQQTAVLLKRIALTTGGRESTQHLSGEPWLKHLDKLFATDFFTLGDGRVFGTALYQANVSAKDNVLTDLKQLIKRHKRQHT